MMRWIKRAVSSKRIRSAGIFILSIGLIFVLCMSVWAAEGDYANREICFFYLDTLKTIHAEEGTPASELPLPTIITAQVYLATTETVDGAAEMVTKENAAQADGQPISGAAAAIRPMEIMEIPVTWESLDYRTEAGTYTFTAVLPENYTTAEDLPTVQVQLAVRQDTEQVYTLEASTEAAPQCTCGATEGAAHADACPLYTAPQCTCGATDGQHSWSCALSVPEAVLSDAPALYNLPTSFGVSPSPTTETSVNRVIGQTNTFEVTLRLYHTVDSTQSQNDIVLVMDGSDSMTGTTLSRAKAGVVNLINAALSSPTSDSRIAVVAFAEQFSLISDFKGYDQKDSLIAAVNAISGPVGSATSMQAGLHKARGLLSSSAGNKSVVLLSDGHPNLSYGLQPSSEFINAKYPDNPNGWWMTATLGSDLYYVNSPAMKESGFNYGRSDIGDRASSIYIDIDGSQQPVYNSTSMAALAEANMIKGMGATIYSVGYYTDTPLPADTQLMQDIASGNQYYAGGTSTIEDILGQIGGIAATNSFKNGSINQAITPGFVLDTSFTPVSKSSTFTTASDNISWSIPSISEPTLNVTGLAISNANTYYAELVYRIVATDAITTLPITPDVDGNYVTLKENPDVNYTDNTGAAAAVTLPNPPVTLDITPPPPISTIMEGDTVISGTTAAGATVIVTLPDGTKHNTVADAMGNWSVNVPSSVTLTEGQQVTATAKDGNKLTSLLSNATVVKKVNATGTLQGVVWIDANGDGKIDFGELPRTGLTLGVFANDDLVCTTPVNDTNGAPLTIQTDTAGAYRFNNVPAGTYQVVAQTPTGYRATVLAQDNSAVDDSRNGWLVVSNLAIPVSATPTVLNQNLGLYAKLSYTKSASVAGGAYQPGTSDAPIVAELGQLITFRITVRSEAPSGTFSGITVKDIIPRGLDIETTSAIVPAGGAVDETHSLIQWKNVSINPGDNVFEFTTYLRPFSETLTVRTDENTAEIVRNGIAELTNTVHLKLLKGNAYQLGITKTLTAAATEAETFVFQIQRLAPDGSALGGIFYATITIPQGQTSASIRLAGLYASNYSVTELQSNWRYSTVGGASQTVAVTRDGNATVTFSNQKTNDHWLSDKAEVSNQMTINPA